MSITRIPNESQPSSPVERILICHPTLAEKCLDGKSLSEDADLDELAEEIFLYTSGKQDDSSAHSDSWKKQAVQFMGLCVALYSLPSSLKDDERTKQVYLGKSTLIFVPLEEDAEILAVLQIRRGGGNPLAVRQSIEKCHSLFCMFHQGGILNRLRGNKMTNDSNCIYPGLDQLYLLRKDIRKHRIKQSRLSNNDDNFAKLQDQMKKLSLELDQLHQQLPNESIRRDLESHYNEYLDNLSLVMSRQGGGLRCLVDCVPAPMAQASGLHTVQSSPHQLSPEVISKLKTDMQHILSQENHQSILFGISCFYMGHLIQIDFFGNGSSSHFSDISSETVTTIMGYMASYRIKLQQQNAHDHNVSSPLRFGKIASSLASNYQDHPSGQTSVAVPNEYGVGSFLVPPPSYMMSGTEGNQSIDIQNGQVAWAPTITLPKNGNEERHQNARVLLYAIGDFSFLVFLHTNKLDLQSDAGKVVVSSALVSVHQQLNLAVQTSQTMSPATSSKLDLPNKPSSSNCLREPGVDYILIDRKQQELILFTDHHAVVQSPKKKAPAPNGASPRKGLFGFLPPKVDAVPTTQDEQKIISPRTLEWSVLGLDCRHLLASHLHLDVLLAFDDMMNDISTKFSSEKVANNYVELCTCMTLGWVYGCANKDTELYAFFDSSTYVTVSDVQNAVKRIKEKVSQS